MNEMDNVKHAIAALNARAWLFLVLPVITVGTGVGHAVESSSIVVCPPIMKAKE
jgi:hypothetical protein